MERMKDLTQQYVEQLNSIIKDLREEKFKLVEENERLKSDLEEENKKLKEDVDYFRQCYLDLKKLCEKEGFMLSDEEITKMFDLDKIK